MKAFKIIRKSTSTETDTSGLPGDSAIWEATLSRKQKSNEKLPLKDVRERIFGGRPIGIGKSSDGIIGYNETMLKAGMPRHCCTLYRLAELLLEWGHDPLPWLKGEAKEVGYLPGSAVALPD